MAKPDKNFPNLNIPNQIDENMSQCDNKVIISWWICVLKNSNSDKTFE